MAGDATGASDDELRELAERLLVRDREAHAEAVAALAAVGDERVVPHLVELVVIDAVAADWERFGFPEVLRERAPPRYLELPEVRWPGVREALAALAEPAFDSGYAWVEWESWYSQQEVEPLAGFPEWKLRLYRSYLPPVGSLLDVEPREFDLQEIRWGNCDRSFLAALNAPTFRPAGAVDAESAGDDAERAGDDGEDASGNDGGASGNGGGASGNGERTEDDTGDARRAEDGTGGDPGRGDRTGGGDATTGHRRHLRDGDRVFGFEIEGVHYAVPRWVLFPHELLNAELQGVPVSLTFCTLCNAPILYDRRVGGAATGSRSRGSQERRVGGETLTFGSTGMLLSGNKVMYDEETETLWDQHAGVPIAGHYLDRDPDLVLDALAVTRTDWGTWRAEHPDTLALDPETGYGYDYSFYDGDLGIFRHYWENEDVIQPGVRRESGPPAEKAACYGLVGAGGEAVWVVPVDDLDGDAVVSDVVDGREVVALLDRTGDVAIYEAPPTPVERTDDAVVDAHGTRWTPSRTELHGESGETRDRIAGRHGLWFAFRTHYDEAHVLGA